MIKPFLAIVLSLTFTAEVSAQTTRASTETIPGTVVKFDMIQVPAGKLKDKEIKPFWIGKTEVTWDEFDIWAFQLDLTDQQKAEGHDAESRPSKPYGAPDRGYGHAGFPALAMSDHTAKLYCEWLSKKTGKKFRLPTEAEWEYAATAGGADKPANLAEAAWTKDNSDNKTHAVAKKAPNGFGIYDMLGNVQEWCTVDKDNSVTRGGSFKTKSADVGVATRIEPIEDWNASDPQTPKSIWWLNDAPFVGFRVVRED